MQSPDGGLVAIAYSPCVIEARPRGKPVRLEVKTEYPFGDSIAIHVAPSERMRFPIRLRIPGWVDRAVIRDETGVISPPSRDGFVVIDREWSGPTELSLEFPSSVRLYHGYNDAVAIRRGPLLYCLGIGAEWRKVKDNPRFADWEVYPTTPWNYALAIDREHPDRSVTIELTKGNPPRFSPGGSPIVARVKGRRLPGWGIERGAAAPPPMSPVESEAPLEELALVPYGCTDLRITEFPTLSRP
jgi:hypothetical protein